MLEEWYKMKYTCFTESMMEMNQNFVPRLVEVEGS